MHSETLFEGQVGSLIAGTGWLSGPVGLIDLPVLEREPSGCRRRRHKPPRSAARAGVSVSASTGYGTSFLGHGVVRLKESLVLPELLLELLFCQAELPADDMLASAQLL